MSKRLCSVALIFAIIIQGCCSVPYRGRNPQNYQFERGYSIAPIDWTANLLALPYKLLFWSWRLQNHCISTETEQDLAAFLKDKNLNEVKVYIAKFSLFGEMKRLWSNSEVAWPYRIFPGFTTTLIAGLTDWLIGGDYYNPFTNSIHLFSDDTAIALHEGGHALDFSKRKYKGTYAIMRILTGADTYQEWVATDEALHYLQDKKMIEKEIQAYKILYPAYASYIGGALSIFVPIPYVTSTASVLVGHIVGRRHASKRKKDWQRVQELENDYRDNMDGSTQNEAKRTAPLPKVRV